MSQRNETYRVELLGFPGASAEEATEALAKAFGVAEELARSYITEAPCAVRSGVDGATAREYTQSLLGIGASVRVVAETSGRAREFTSTDLLALTAAENAGPAPHPAETDGGAAEPEPAPKRDEDVTGSRPVRLDEPAGPRTTTCPACAHRQGPAPICANCGYEFPKTLERHSTSRLAELEHQRSSSRSTPPPAQADLDVFENLRTSSERRAVEVRRVREARKGRKARRRAALSSSQSVMFRRRRLVVYVVLAAVVVATLLFVLLTPPEEQAGDPLPEDAIPPPPGLQYRRL